MVHNQVLVVPRRVLAEVKAYAENRRALMQQIEQEDVRQLKEQEISVEVAVRSQK